MLFSFSLIVIVCTPIESSFFFIYLCIWDFLSCFGSKFQTIFWKYIVCSCSINLIGCEKDGDWLIKWQYMLFTIYNNRLGVKKQSTWLVNKSIEKTVIRNAMFTQHIVTYFHALLFVFFFFCLKAWMPRIVIVSTILYYKFCKHSSKKEKKTVKMAKSCIFDKQN